MEDLTNALAVLFAGAIVLAPVMALSVRFALKPFWDSYLRMRAAQTPELLEKRVALLEAELQHLDQALSRIVDADEFQRQLMKSSSIPPAPENPPAEDARRSSSEAWNPNARAEKIS